MTQAYVGVRIVILKVANILYQEFVFLRNIFSGIQLGKIGKNVHEHDYPRPRFVLVISFQPNRVRTLAPNHLKALRNALQIICANFFGSWPNWGLKSSLCLRYVSKIFSDGRCKRSDGGLGRIAHVSNLSGFSVKQSYKWSVW